MTMTLEQLRDELDGSALGTQERHVLIVDSIEAAIRERDRLRGDVAGMTEELLHVPSRDDWRELQQRAERAEAELAALKARIMEAPLHTVSFHIPTGITCIVCDVSMRGQRVRLLVEE